MAKRKRAKLLPIGNSQSKEQLKEKREVNRNLVAKFAKSFNKSHCHLDKKAAQKRGKMKHRIRYTGRDLAKGVKLINLFSLID